MAVSRSEQLVVGPTGTEQGVRTFWWRREADGSFRIVGSEFKPAELGLAANYLEDVSAAVSADLESWRKAWEGGRLDDYMGFYAADAVQQGPLGQKTSVALKGNSLGAGQARGATFRPSPSHGWLHGIRADKTKRMRTAQAHRPGTKTLLLRFDGKNWRIGARIGPQAPAAPAPAGQSPRHPARCAEDSALRYQGGSASSLCVTTAPGTQLSRAPGAVF